MTDQSAQPDPGTPEPTEEDLHNEAAALVDEDSPSAEFVDQEDDTTEAEVE